MKQLLVVVLVAAFVFVVRAESDVVELTAENFKTQVNNGDKWLVEFFAPWCGHCKQLAPTWEKLGTALKGEVSVGKVDCTQQIPVCTAFAVRGYPTIKLLSQGKYFDYKGARTVEAFSEFAKKAHDAGTDFPAAYAEVTASEDKHDL